MAPSSPAVSIKFLFTGLTATVYIYFCLPLPLTITFVYTFPDRVSHTHIAPSSPTLANVFSPIDFVSSTSQVYLNVYGLCSMSLQYRILPWWSPLSRPFDDHSNAKPASSEWPGSNVSGYSWPRLNMDIGALSTLTAIRVGSFSQYLALFG